MKKLEEFSKSGNEILRNQQMKSIIGGTSTNKNESHATIEGNCPDTATSFTIDVGNDVCKGETCTKPC